MDPTPPFTGPAHPATGDINRQDLSTGNAWLHEACAATPCLDTVSKAVQQQGADLKLLNRQKLTPLGVAIKSGASDLVERLIDLGSELYFKINERETFHAVELAITENKPDILRKILKKGGGQYLNEDRKAQYAVGTCLQIAAKNNQPQMAQQLIDAGALLNLESGYKNHTPLITAAQAVGDTALLLRTLVQAGAALDQRHSITGLTALHYAVKGNHSIAIKSLLALGADPECETPDGQTPLMLAAARGQSEDIQALLDAGADPNKRTRAIPHRTALMIAAKEKTNHEAITCLLQGGADPLLTDDFNQTAQRYADRYNCSARLQIQEAEHQATIRFFDKSYKRYHP